MPNCRAYDPAFAYEMAVIVRDGIARMYGREPEDCFYYLTLYNENYPMPPMPEGVEDGIVRGLYKWADAPDGPRPSAPRSLFSRPARWCARAPRRPSCAEQYDVGADVWSDVVQGSCARRRSTTERWNRLHPVDSPRGRRTSPSCSADAEGPIVAVTDFMKAVPEQVGRGSSDGRSSRSAPTATASPTPARRCAATSRSTRRTSSSRCCDALAATGDVKAETVREAIAATTSTPRRSTPRRARAADRLR